MANVYIEPRPKARYEHEPIDHYVLEYANNEPVTPMKYKTQAEAVTEAKQLGHSPLVSRVRVTNKGNPDHWRHACLGRSSLARADGTAWPSSILLLMMLPPPAVAHSPGDRCFGKADPPSCDRLSPAEGLWVAAISGNGRRPNLIPGWTGRLASRIGDRWPLWAW